VNLALSNENFVVTLLPYEMTLKRTFSTPYRSIIVLIIRFIRAKMLSDLIEAALMAKPTSTRGILPEIQKRKRQCY